MAGLKIEHLSITSVVAAATSENFPTLEPSDKNKIIRGRYVEKLAVHFIFFKGYGFAKAFRNGVSRINQP